MKLLILSIFLSTFAWARVPNVAPEPSGTFTVTEGSVNSCGGWSNGSGRYFVLGDIVHMCGRLSVTSCGTGFISVSFNLPIASNFTATTDLDGVGGSNNAAAVASGAKLRGDATNDEATVLWHAVGAGSYDWHFCATYEVK